MFNKVAIITKMKSPIFFLMQKIGTNEINNFNKIIKVRFFFLCKKSGQMDFCCFYKKLIMADISVQ